MFGMITRWVGPSPSKSFRALIDSSTGNLPRLAARCDPLGIAPDTLSFQIENNMNSVERVLHYGTSSLPQEKPHFIENMKPPQEWPSRGAISFDNVVMSYRAGLPPVLKGL